MRSVADRSAVEVNIAFAPHTTEAPQGRAPVDREPPDVGRDSVDSAERGPLAGKRREPFVRASGQASSRTLGSRAARREWDAAVQMVKLWIRG